MQGLKPQGVTQTPTGRRDRHLVSSVGGIGANWGTQASHPLPPETVVRLLRENGIQKSMSASSSKTLTPSKSFRSDSSRNIESLYEITHLPVEQIPETKLAITNPYHVFQKPSSESFTKRVKQLVSSDKSKLPVREFVQCTPFDSLFVKSCHEEQFFTVPISPDICHMALSQGYTHMHFEAIRFAVTFHGRKGLQAVARIAFVDSRLTNYQQAILGNVQATLNAGTVFFTLYPNFNIPLSDPFVCSALKI
ncbi:hypothetical protein LguiB_005484 [Lonicera macranthoides]